MGLERNRLQNNRVDLLILMSRALRACEALDTFIAQALQSNATTQFVERSELLERWKGSERSCAPPKPPRERSPL
jgi:hypothetical protein